MMRETSEGPRTVYGVEREPGGFMELTQMPEERQLSVEARGEERV